MTRTALRGGTVVDGSGREPRRADLVLDGGLVESVGTAPGDVDRVVDVTGRHLFPGFVDTHSHADGAVFRPDVQYALLRQGVTTVISGQDGVSYAPGDGAYATEYFGALNGPHPGYDGGGVAALLAGYDGATPVNVGYLVPAGTVRHEVAGYAGGRVSPEQLAAMRRLVEEGMAAGALGLSSGLDYVPNAHADVEELAELCRPVAAVDGLYVTHMRGGYETNAKVGTDEVTAIARAASVRVHISHLHGPSRLLLSLLDEMADAGVDVTFDAYPYRRGCTLLAMLLLPADLLSGPRPQVIATLASPEARARLRQQWFPALEAGDTVGPEWPDNFTFAHVGAPGYGWAHGLTVSAAAARSGTDPVGFALEVLVASALEVTVVIRVREQRSYDDLARLATHPAYMLGSDGIYVGAHPHPRGWGSTAKYLRLFVRERGDLSWQAGAWHLAGLPAERLGLRDRGRLAPGYAADVVVADLERLGDVAGYSAPNVPAEGIDDVFVGGEHVLAAGELTGTTSGRGLRRSARPTTTKESS